MMAPKDTLRSCATRPVVKMHPPITDSARELGFNLRVQSGSSRTEIMRRLAFWDVAPARESG